MKLLLNCLAYYEQSYWREKVITVFIISLYLQVKGHSHVTPVRVSSDLPRHDISVKVSKWETWF